MASSVAEVVEVKEVRGVKQVQERAPVPTLSEDGRRIFVYDP